MIDLNWENLRKFFVWANKAGADGPYVDDGERAIMIDGSIRLEDLDRFLAEQKNFTHEHHWADISTHTLEANKKLECCTTCGEKREIDR